jgi:hypothetical protein
VPVAAVDAQYRVASWRPAEASLPTRGATRRRSMNCLPTVIGAAAIGGAVIGAAVIAGIASVSVKASADTDAYRAQPEPLASASATAIMAAAASKMATATAAVTATTTMARHSASRHCRHAERCGRRDCNDCSTH